MSFPTIPPWLPISTRWAGPSPHLCAVWHWTSGHGAGNMTSFLWPATCPWTRTSLQMPCPGGATVTRRSGPSTMWWPERSFNTGQPRMWTCSRRRRTTSCQCSSQSGRPPHLAVWTRWRRTGNASTDMRIHRRHSSRECCGSWGFNQRPRSYWWTRSGPASRGSANWHRCWRICQRDDLLKNAVTGMRYPKPEAMRLTVWPLSANPSLTAAFQQTLLKRQPEPDESQLAGFMVPAFNGGSRISGKPVDNPA